MSAIFTECQDDKLDPGNQYVYGWAEEDRYLLCITTTFGGKVDSMQVDIDDEDTLLSLLDAFEDGVMPGMCEVLRADA